MTTMLDFVMARINIENNGISLEEFTNAMRSGSETERREAVEAMLAAGGYENLD